jgi:hypothetical protein
MAVQQERVFMHKNAAFSAIRRALVRRLPHLPQTVEGRVKIELLARDIMKSVDEEGLRFISANKD